MSVCLNEQFPWRRRGAQPCATYDTLAMPSQAVGTPHTVSPLSSPATASTASPALSVASSDMALRFTPPPGLEDIFGLDLPPLASHDNSAGEDNKKSELDAGKGDNLTEEGMSLRSERDMLAKEVERLRVENDKLTKAAMVGVWTYGGNPIELKMTETGALRFIQEVNQGSKTGTRASWELQQVGDWFGCDIVANNGISYGSVQFRLDATRTRVLVRFRSPVDGHNCTRTAKRVTVSA